MYFDSKERERKDTASILDFILRHTQAMEQFLTCTLVPQFPLSINSKHGNRSIYFDINLGNT